MTKLKPDFWDHEDVAAGASKQRFRLRRLWKTLVLAAVALVITPALAMMLIDLEMNRRAVESDLLVHTTQLVSAARSQVVAFFTEHEKALDFIVRANAPAALEDRAHLKEILGDLQRSGYGFADLGRIGEKGVQPSYGGSAARGGNQDNASVWYRQTPDVRSHVSSVFSSVRQMPHLEIVVQRERPRGGFFGLFARVDPRRIERLLGAVDPSGRGDVFLVDQHRVLHTPSRYQGNVLQRIQPAVPDFSEGPYVHVATDGDGKALSVGYARISGTPFILMVVRPKDDLLRPWRRDRQMRLGFFAGIIGLMLLLSLGGATYLTKRLHLADHQRVVTLHEVEYAHKMASLGRLSAGVAHEINNPLAIINEKAGLIKDLFTIGRRYSGDAKLMGLIESILASVDRCGRVTRRLLNFARHIDVNPQQLHFGEVIHEVLGFLGKDAEYRSIQVVVDVPPDIPPVFNDRGRIQEIFLNLLNNSFAAISDGGRLEIAVRPQPPDFIVVTVADDGRGIPEADLKRIFEPFFSTRVKGGGTGLGLSITYGLVKEIGATISVTSEVGKGTRFTVTLPLNFKERRTAIEGAFSRW